MQWIFIEHAMSTISHSHLIGRTNLIETPMHRATSMDPLVKDLLKALAENRPWSGDIASTDINALHLLVTFLVGACMSSLSVYVK